MTILRCVYHSKTNGFLQGKFHLPFPSGKERLNPPFLFWSCQKRNGPFTVQREKTLLGCSSAASCTGKTCFRSGHDRTCFCFYLRAFRFATPCRGRLKQAGRSAPLREGNPKGRAAARPFVSVGGRCRRGKSKSPSCCVFWTGRGPFSPQGENGGRIPAAKRRRQTLPTAQPWIKKPPLCHRGI